MKVRLCMAIRHHTIRPDWATNAALAELVRRESHGNLCAVNPTRTICGYQGTRACGIFQFVPCRCNPMSYILQARCGVAYIVGRYRTPEAALRHHDRYGWY